VEFVWPTSVGRNELPPSTREGRIRTLREKCPLELRVAVQSFFPGTLPKHLTAATNVIAQPSPATISPAFSNSIMSPLVNDRAARHWSQVKLKTQAGLFQRLHWRTGSASRLALSQLAIVVRSAVPSSNFSESGRAARATAIIPPFGAPGGG